MGKPTGFMEYDRVDKKAQSPKERIKHFNEFHTPLSKEEQQRQGARCMDCGVPFCQAGVMIAGMASGCPLRNLIPEWNDLLYMGNWEQAYKRLKRTSSFPEFTGRVCPALCEKACTCKKIAIVGSGPSGLAAADQLNHRGHSVTVFERFDRIGGLLRYGIPNMKLEKHIIDRKIEMMKAEGVEFVVNTDIGKDKKAADLLKEYDRVILACGASNPRDIKAPGRELNGIYFAVDFLRATTKSLLDSFPRKGRMLWSSAAATQATTVWELPSAWARNL